MGCKITMNLPPKKPLTEQEIEKRIEELLGKISENITHNKSIALRGEIAGLRWVLQFWHTGYYETL